MKKSWRVLGILSCVLCLTLVFAAGCAKKQLLTDKQAGAGIGGAAGDQSALSPEEQAAREKALKEQALRERALREKASQEQALREKAEKERLAREKETAAAVASEAARITAYSCVASAPCPAWTPASRSTTSQRSPVGSRSNSRTIR